MDEKTLERCCVKLYIDETPPKIGTGAFVSKDGYILTAYHNIFDLKGNQRNISSVSKVSEGGKLYQYETKSNPFQVVKKDKDCDIVFIKLDLLGQHLSEWLSIKSNYVPKVGHMVKLISYDIIDSGRPTSSEKKIIQVNGVDFIIEGKGYPGMSGSPVLIKNKVVGVVKQIRKDGDQIIVTQLHVRNDCKLLIFAILFCVFTAYLLYIHQELSGIKSSLVEKEKLEEKVKELQGEKESLQSRLQQIADYLGKFKKKDSPNLAGIDLRGLKISDYDFRGCNLTKANFSDATIERTLFGDAILREAILKNANIKSCNFNGARLEKAKFNGSTLRDSSIYETVWNGADVTDATILNEWFGDKKTCDKTDWNTVIGLGTVKRNP